MDNNLNINNLNNTPQPKILEQLKLTEQTTTEGEQYKYLKELNKRLTLFKKRDDKSRKKNEETE